MLCCAELLQLCLTLCDPMDHSPPGSSVHRIHQTRVGWGGCHILLQGSFWPRGWVHLLHLLQVLYLWCHLGSPWMLVLVLKCSREGTWIRRVFSNEILEMVSEMEIIKALWKERTLAREVLYQPRCSGLLETDVSEHSNHLPTPFTLFLFSLPRWKKYVDIKACIPVPYYEKDIFFGC